jgi:hypothetical protein
MPRKLVWVETTSFQGFGCSECDWKFRPSGTLTGRSIDEMKTAFEEQRDKEFAAHPCVKPKSPIGRIHLAPRTGS